MAGCLDLDPTSALAAAALLESLAARLRAYAQAQRARAQASAEQRTP